MNYKGFYTLIRREAGRTKRVLGQAVIAPLMTASLYIFVFGYIMGKSMPSISGLSYLAFVFPGVFAMNLIIAVFSATSFSIYFAKFQKTIEDMLTLPISYTELVVSMLINGLMRAALISAALTFVGFVFGVVGVVHPFVLLLYVFIIAVLFGLLGIVVGIWADNSFEKFGIAANFILTPLTFLGGAFYSVSMLPEGLKFLIYFNPIFYAVDGIRYALTGYNEYPIINGFLILSALSLLTLSLCVYIFKTGWKLRS